jgi:hypothetical protein
MNYKYLVQFLNEDGSIKVEEYYKTIKDISTKYNIDGHILRDVIKITEGTKTKKFIHPQNEIIYKRFKITTIKPTFEYK